MFDTLFCLCYFIAVRNGGIMKNGGNIENIERQSLLYDFYGALLSDSQNEVMALYHEDNLSLSEIASELAGYHRNQELASKAREIIGEAGDAELLSIIDELSE